VHDRALADASLAQAREQLMRAVQRAMDAADPELPRLAARVERMPAEVAAARQRGDADRLALLERELAQIQARFMRVRSAVQRQPEIARQTRAYEERLRERMIAIEPLTENLLSRSGELQRLLQSALSPTPED
jgi:capsule polysaccharide export protein KpsE/RkpR